MRRNKQEMRCMRDLVEMWLNDFENNPHEAYNQFIKWHLENNIKLPNHVKGIKDFIKVSKENKHEYEFNKKLEEKKIQDKLEAQNAKDSILNISLEKIKEVWNNVKLTGTEKEKISICEVYQFIYEGTIDKWKYTASDVYILKKYNLI